jgi:HSP20 family protein
MTLMRFDPFRELDRLAEQSLATGRTPRAMPMEAFRRGDQFVVALDLPGARPEDVDVTVERNVLTVRTVRRPLRQEGDEVDEVIDEVIIDERPQGEFSRQLFLGDNLDTGSIAADFDLGVLTVTIPVAEASKPRKVEISAHTQTGQVIESGSPTPTATSA